MIYPKEGSVLNSNPAGLVDAAWVSDEHVDAAREWIDHLREEDQQRKFMDAGFRPATGTGFSVDERQYASWGLTAQQPRSRIEPGHLQPAVLDGIISSWGAVKKPAIVTFVVDVSGSMNGEPLAQVQGRSHRLVDAIADSASQGSADQVGLVTFSDTVQIEIAPSPIQESKYEIADAIHAMSAKGETALFDAVRRAIALTDSVAGDPRATRAVVVLSDGAATAGTCLHAVVSMISRDEVPVGSFCGMQDEQPVDDEGRQISTEDVNGGTLVLPHDDPVQVFFLGFGDADVHIGRILAEATGAEYQGSTDEDLAAVIEELSGYF